AFGSSMPRNLIASRRPYVCTDSISSRRPGGPPIRPTITSLRPPSWSMPPGTRVADRRPPAPRRRRPVATAHSAATGVPAPGPSLLVEDLKLVGRIVLLGRRVEQRPHRLDRASLTPDHPPHLVRRDVHLEDVGVVLPHRVHLHLVRLVHQTLRHLLHPAGDVRGVPVSPLAHADACAVRARARIDRTVSEACAPFLIHSSAFATSSLRT